MIFSTFYCSSYYRPKDDDNDDADVESNDSLAYDGDNGDGWIVNIVVIMYYISKFVWFLIVMIN